MDDTNTTPTCWKCTQCGHRYVDPSPTSLFIVPPPTTPCTRNQTRDSRVLTNSSPAVISSTGGTKCDYVRMQHATPEVDPAEPVADSEDGACALDIASVSKIKVQASDIASMKTPGEHGRVSRYSDAAYAACEEQQQEEEEDKECEFWKEDCKDVDCIYKKKHCRYQCAMAELDEEPKPTVSTLKHGLRFRWLAK